MPYTHKALGELCDHGRDALDMLESAARQGLHIGEIGIDRRLGHLDEQDRFFRDALAISAACGRIAVIHLVQSYEMTYQALKDAGTERFIIHGYTGSYEMAERFLSLGGMISLGRRSMKAKSFRSLLRLPFLTESDMPAGEKQRQEIRQWNEELSLMLGRDIAEDTWRMLASWL